MYYRKLNKLVMDKLQYSNLLHIQEASKQGRLVVFVGAGVSANSGVPVWSALIKEMKNECNLEYENDDLKIAQLYKDARGEKEYLDKVKEILRHNKVTPNDIHKDILALNPCHIITTNYDNLMEQEIQNEFKQYAIIREDRDLPNMVYSNSVVKMHGDFDTNNIVLTESDYHNYAKNFPLIRSFVISLFASKLVVFIGFSFSDLNLKIILNDVHSVLNDSMQKAYLITDERPDVLTVKYYDKKGINVVYLENSDIEAIHSSLKTDKSTSLKAAKGIYLHNILNCICLVNKHAEYDLASMLYAKMKSYKDEIKVLDDGLRYFIPKEELQMWNLHSNGLQIYSPYFHNLHEQLKTFGGRRRFIKEHSEIDRNELKGLAYYNNLYRIDDVTILNTESQYNIEKFFDTHTALSYLYKMDFVRLNERLRYLSSRQLSCDADDLEYPFTLYMLGNYYEAYQLFNKIMGNAWKNGKYILYFICLYNIYSIRVGIYWQLSKRNDIDAKSIYEKLCDIDLDSVLRRLPVEEEIRKVFQDLLSFRAIGIRVTEMEELKEQLHQQRKSGEKGGVSINSHIANLLSKFEREFHFCNNNYIICDNNKQYHSVCINTVSGILNSYATPDTLSDGLKIRPTKIDIMFPLCIFAFIFCVENTELKKIFNQYEIDKIKLSDESIQYVNSFLKNLYETKNVPYIERVKFSSYLQNLVFICSRVENDGIDVEVLFKVAIKYWNDLNLKASESCLNGILNRYKPSKDVLLQITIILIDNLDYDGNYSGCFSFIAYYMSEYGLTLKDIKLYEIKKKNNAQDLYYLYGVLDDCLKKEFSEYCQQNLTRVTSYFKFIGQNKLPIASVERFREMIREIDKKQDPENAFCCRILANMRKNEYYSDVHSIIDEFANTNECMKFFIEPLAYNNKQDIKPIWLLYEDEEIFNILVKTEACNDIIKMYLDKNRFISRDQLLRIFHALLKALLRD